MVAWWWWPQYDTPSQTPDRYWYGLTQDLGSGTVAEIASEETSQWIFLAVCAEQVHQKLDDMDAEMC